MSTMVSDYKRSICNKCIHASGKCSSKNIYPIVKQCDSFEQSLTIDEIQKALDIIKNTDYDLYCRIVKTISPEA